jgi:hypothetical protein
MFHSMFKLSIFIIIICNYILLNQELVNLKKYKNKNLGFTLKAI